MDYSSNNHLIGNHTMTHQFVGDASFSETVTIRLSRNGEIFCYSKIIIKLPEIKVVKYTKSEATNIINTWILNLIYWNKIKESEYNLFLLDNIFDFARELTNQEKIVCPNHNLIIAEAA